MKTFGNLLAFSPELWLLAGAIVVFLQARLMPRSSTTTVALVSLVLAFLALATQFKQTITILDGEVYLTDGANAAPGNRAERRLGPGEVVFFHDGSTATWRVPDHVRKIATVKRPLPAPIGTLYRVAKQARDWLKPQPARADSL